MKKRLESAKRLMHLQDQKVRLAESELARLRLELQSLTQEEARLHGQIEGTIGGSVGIFDLLFRRLDQITRRQMEKHGAIAAVSARLREEKIRGQAAERLKEDVQAIVLAEEDRQELLDIVERVARPGGSSFR